MTQQVEQDNTTSVNISAPKINIQIMDFQAPQIAFLPDGGYKSQLFQMPINPMNITNNIVTASVNSNGLAAVITKQNALIYNVLNGALVKNISLSFNLTSQSFSQSFSNLISDDDGNFYLACADQASFNTTLSLYKINSSSSTVTSNYIDSVNNDYYLVTPNIFQFSSGDIGVVYSQSLLNNGNSLYSIKYSLNGNPPIVLTNSTMYLWPQSVWPVIDDGFLVELLSQNYTETALIYDIKGQQISSLLSESANDAYIKTAHQINNDTFLWVVQNSTDMTAYSQIYNLQTGGGPKLSQHCASGFPGFPNGDYQIQILENGQIIYLTDCPSGNAIINADNTFYANQFGFEVYNPEESSQWIDSAVLSNGDVIALASTGLMYVNTVINSYYLRTSQLLTQQKNRLSLNKATRNNKINNNNNNYAPQRMLSRQLLSLPEDSAEDNLNENHKPIRPEPQTSGAGQLTPLFSLPTLSSVAGNLAETTKGALRWFGLPQLTHTRVHKSSVGSANNNAQLNLPDSNNAQLNLPDSSNALIARLTAEGKLVKTPPRRYFYQHEQGGGTVSSRELPCYYPDKSTNLISTVGRQPDKALIGACTIPQERPFLEGLQRGAISGARSGFLTQLFIDQGMSERQAEIAAEGVTTAIIFNLSPAAAALYVLINRIPSEELGKYGKPIKYAISTTIEGATSLCSGSGWWETAKKLGGNFVGNWMSSSATKFLTHHLLASTPELMQKPAVKKP